MRTFIAIELPAEVRAALTDLSQRLRGSRASASWVKPERMHLTLRFLGEIPESDVARVGSLLEEHSAPLRPFALSVANAGVFPNSRQPRVVWAGVGPLDGGLRELQRIAEDGARATGLKPERRPFRPHLTLARIRGEAHAHELMTLVARERSFDGGSFSVASVSLFSSELTPSGPVYRRLRECPLKGTDA
jgi:RNA 2',3'-cyclic 3'-phosphodiesterase